MTHVRSRRVILGLGALCMMPMPITATVAMPEASKPDEELAGQLLVAMPEMSDPRFHRTVILMVQHNRSGALGIVINRPTQEVPIAKLLSALQLDSRAVEGTVQLFAGGPVQPQVGFIVHSAEYRRPDTIDIDGRVAMTRNPEVLRDIGRRTGPRQSLVAFGYAGWGSGQLEGELQLGGWFTIPEDPKLVFDVDRSKLWDEAMKRRTISL